MALEEWYGVEFETKKLVDVESVFEVAEYKSDLETYLGCLRVALQECNWGEFERNVSNFKGSFETRHCRWFSKVLRLNLTQEHSQNCQKRKKDYLSGKFDKKIY